MASKVDVHPAQRDGYVDVFALKGGDILLQDGLEYRVADGFDHDSSSCWRDSRWVRCTLIASPHYGAFLGAIRYVNPSAALARIGGAA